MKEIWNWIQVAFAAIGGTLRLVFGRIDGFLYALIAFSIVVDYITACFGQLWRRNCPAESERRVSPRR